MKEKYNELAKKQSEYYKKINSNLDEFAKNHNEEEVYNFIQDGYGLTQEEKTELCRTKRSVDTVIKELNAEGVFPTAEELIYGFEVI